MVLKKFRKILKEYELILLKKRASRYNYELIDVNPINYSELFIENYFKTSYNKNALLSYIIYPFTGIINNKHSNLRECYTIAEILNELGYNVDVINWDNTKFLPQKSYDLVIDNHNNLKRLCNYFDKKTLKVFHATNAHWQYQNKIEYTRHYEYFLKKGNVISPSRLLPPGDSAECCDIISMFGNSFTAGTYGKYASKICHLPMSVTITSDEVKHRNYITSKNKFVWLNSHGFLLKGLDVVVDAFIHLPSLELYICTDLSKEPEFYNHIQSVIKKHSNIKYWGWIDTEDFKFNELCNKSTWVISASFSEGGGGSILNCMAKGLIPIISRSTSIELPENTGFYLDLINPNELVSLIKKCIMLSEDELRIRSNNILNFVKLNHTLPSFRKNYKWFLIQAIKTHIKS